MLNLAQLIGSAALNPEWHGEVGGRVALLPVLKPVLKPVLCISCGHIIFFIDLGWGKTDEPIYEESHLLAACEASRCWRADHQACKG